MKRTITVNLSGLVFTLDDDAYEALNHYLDAIKDYFQKTGDEEVVKDIESSIAEKFSEKITKAKEVINKKDVDELIKVMGAVDDIIEEDTNGREGREEKEEINHEKGKKYRTGKKLYRNPDDAVIAGVCSGLAAFFGIDSVIVRLFFGISIFFGGAGVILYIILWLVMPTAETSTQKLEMRGEPVTLEALEEVAKKKSKKLREMDTSGVRRAISLPFRFLGELMRVLGRFIRKFGRIFVVFIGIVLIVSMILSMTAVGFAGAAVVFNYDSPFFHSDIPITDIVNGSMVYVGVAALLLVVIVPLFFILLLGATMVGGKSAFNAATNSVLIGIWMVAVITTGVVAIDLAPRIKAQVDAYNQVGTVEREYEYSDIDSLRIGVSGDVKLSQGEEFELKITADEDTLNKIKFEEKDGELKIIQSGREEGICIVCLKRQVMIEITMPTLESFIAFQSAQVDIKGFDGTDFRVNAGESARVKVYTSGGNIVSYVAGTHGRVEIIGSPDTIDATLEGMGRFTAMDLDSKEVKIYQDVLTRVTLAGTADKLIAELEGSGKLYAYELAVNEAQIKATSHSRAEVYAREKLTMIAQEHGVISYKGNPGDVSERKAQGGVIRQIRDYEFEDVGDLESDIEIQLDKEIDLNIEYGKDLDNSDENDI